jgi:hypothetical protein
MENSATKKLLLLLSGCVQNQAPLIDIAKSQLDRSADMKVIKERGEYLYISAEAKEWKKQADKLHIPSLSLVHIYETQSEIRNKVDHFRRLNQASAGSIRNASYDVHLVHKNKVQSLKTENPLYAKMLAILARSHASTPAEALRNYLKWHWNRALAEEYIRLRPYEWRQRDEQRAKHFLYGGTAAGGVAGLSFFFSDMVQRGTFEMYIWGVAAALFFAGIFRIHRFLNVFATYFMLLAWGMFLLSFIKGMNEGAGVRLLAQAVLCAGIGSLIGGMLGIAANSLPSSYRERRSYRERQSRSRIVSSAVWLLLAMGVSWYMQVLSPQSLSYSVIHPVMKTLGVTPWVQKEAEKPQEKEKPKGKVTVVTPGANVRQAPDLQGNVITAVEQGQSFYYYAEQKDKRGKVWYLIDTGKYGRGWISGKTVKK